MSNSAPTDDLTALEQAATKATPGPWRLMDNSDEDVDEFSVAADSDAIPGDVYIFEDAVQGRADAEFIAAASPDVVQALIARTRTAEADIGCPHNGNCACAIMTRHEWCDVASSRAELVKALEGKRDALQREVERLRAALEEITKIIGGYDDPLADDGNAVRDALAEARAALTPASGPARREP